MKCQKSNTNKLSQLKQQQLMNGFKREQGEAKSLFGPIPLPIEFSA